MMRMEVAQRVSQAADGPDERRDRGPRPRRDPGRGPNRSGAWRPFLTPI